MYRPPQQSWTFHDCEAAWIPKWKDYLVAERRDLVGRWTSTASWAAKRLLGLKSEDEFRAMADQELADRFFLGDLETFRAIRRGYGGIRQSCRPRRWLPGSHALVGGGNP